MTNSDSDLALAIGDRLAERLERHFQIMPTLTLADAAKALDVSDETLRKLCTAGRIPYIKMDRLYRLRPVDINNYLEEHYHGGRK